MTLETDIAKGFLELKKQDIGARFYKVDLHFHTPASEDARGSNKYNFNPYKIKYPPRSDYGSELEHEKAIKDIQDNILVDSRKVAEKIVERFHEEKLALVAISDHNGIGTIWKDPESGTSSMDMRAPTWYELIDAAAEMSNKKAGKRTLTILPSVEISCTGIHILAVFSPTKPRRAIYFTICQLLNEIGFSIDEWGRNPKVGKRSVFDAVNLIKEKGGLPIPAHIDGSDQALLNLYSIKSGAMKNVFTNNLLNAVEIVKPKKFTKIDKKLKTTIKNYIDTLRDKNALPPLAYFQGSDAHDYNAIGKRYTHVKMTYPSFEGLEGATSVPSTRVRISDQFVLDSSALFVYGIEIDSKKFGNYFLRFNRHLNCIMGRKDTGKTNIFNLMRGAIKNEMSRKADDIKLYVEKIEDKQTSHYCFASKKNSEVISFHKFDTEKGVFTQLETSASVDEAVQVKFFDSERMEKLISSNKNMEDFLKKRFGISAKNSIAIFNNKFSISKFLKVEKEELLFIEEKDGNIKLYLNVNWKKGKKKRVQFDNLTSSLKRTVVIIMIIMEKGFGPVIMDAPELALDNIDMADYLVPIITRFKEQRQIIFFSSNPLIAVNGDPENYVLLEAAGKSKSSIISGFSIDDGLKKQRVIEIVEGGIRAYDRRSDWYNIPGR